MISRSIQQQLLTALYDAFAGWAEKFTFSCHKGCATCCTRSVTMTSLEGEGIMTFLAEAGRQAELADPAFSAPSSRTVQCTTNTFVAAHLRGEELEEPENWDLRPCPFLKEESCTIYPVRPFGCRLFASLDPCAASGVADMPPGYLAGATVLLQYIEHLGNGGCWGTMVELLAGLHSGQAEGYGQATSPIPGFLIAPDEQPLVEPLLQDLLAREINGQTFAQWLHAARP
ncbi:YkgJ family cysteine cluster protein [Thiovibrio frasassiensis]|uniref:YkgJ family cysteine cluster protein n=1 Tax=Thiovibrio frasassiensis TaxID=2984131 RepID=A0A9X4MFF5_9BACT|nr:YkgJ family cysteine cluster protein [Thiovibrio frasassiensis]MDG4475308.1 YkgJ family cysteine cluster protein [Thiovibrio frasassiensis]